MESELIGQGIGIIAMIFNILSYQQKRQSALILFQLCGSMLFGVSYFLLHSPMGAMLNILSTVRAVLFIFEDKVRAKHPVWLCIFVSFYVLFYVLAFTVFGADTRWYNFLIELLPVIAMTLFSVGFMYGSSAVMRRVGLISSPCWLTYNIYNGAVGAIICEVFCFASTVIGIIRHDIDRGKRKNEDVAK